MSLTPLRIVYADRSYDSGPIFADLSKNVVEALEEVFAGWNAGSGQEWPGFLSAKVRSLSVGDFVKIENDWFQYNSFGWKPVDEVYVVEWIGEFDKRLAEAEATSKWPIFPWSIQSRMVVEKLLPDM